MKSSLARRNGDLSIVAIPEANGKDGGPRREGTQEAFDVVSKASCSLIEDEVMSSAEFFGGGKAVSKDKGRKRATRQVRSKALTAKSRRRTIPA